MQNLDCMICLSNPSDAVIAPCGHGGVCFKCCQQMIQALVESNKLVTCQITSQSDRLEKMNIYEFRCHLCRKLGLKVFKLKDPHSQSKNDDEISQTNQTCVTVESFIDLIESPL